MTAYSVYSISKYIQWAGSFIIIVGCLPMYRHRFAFIKVLAWYGIAGVVFGLMQQTVTLFFSNYKLNSIGNGFVFFEAVLFGVIFINVSIDNSRKLLFMLLSVYISFYIITLLFFERNSYSLIRAGRDLLLVLNSIIYFYYLIRKLPEENLLKFPMFWISASVLFFFSGTFILSFLIDYIAQVLKDDTSGFWAFRNFFRFGFCLVLAYAGWLDLQRIKNGNSKSDLFIS